MECPAASEPLVALDDDYYYYYHNYYYHYSFEMRASKRKRLKVKDLASVG